MFSGHKRELIEAFKETYERYGPTWRGTDDELVELLHRHHIKSVDRARALGREQGEPPRPPRTPGTNPD